MRVALVGGTGFIGSYLVDALLDDGHTPVLLVRPGSEHKLRRRSECELVSGDVGAVGDLIRLLTNCQAVIYSVGILRENAARGITFESLQYQGLVRTLEAAKVCRVERLLLMSANGVSQNDTDYLTTKLHAERAALSSELNVTVFRPSVVFGDPRGLREFATQLHADMIVPYRPAIGFFNATSRRRREFTMSPVHVKDVADAFVRALSDAQTVGRTFQLGGPEALTWKTILRRIADAVERRKWILPMPIELMALAALLMDRFAWFPVTRDQLRMLAAGNSAEPTDIAALTGRPPRRFDERNLAYLKGGQLTRNAKQGLGAPEPPG